MDNPVSAKQKKKKKKKSIKMDVESAPNNDIIEKMDILPETKPDQPGEEEEIYVIDDQGNYISHKRKKKKKKNKHTSNENDVFGNDETCHDPNTAIDETVKSKSTGLMTNSDGSLLMNPVSIKKKHKKSKDIIKNVEGIPSECVSISLNKSKKRESIETTKKYANDNIDENVLIAKNEIEIEKIDKNKGHQEYPEAKKKKKKKKRHEEFTNVTNYE